MMHEDGPKDESKTESKMTPTLSRVYDIEEIKSNDLPTDTGDIPKDGGEPDLIDDKDFEKTREDVNDVQDEQPSTARRSNRNKGTVDRLSFHTKGTHSSLKSLVKGFLLGLTIHYNYDSTKPRDMGFQGRQPKLNQNPTQFRLETLTSAESNKLREIQTLDMLQDMIDPDPEDHIWKCIAVTRHKVRNLDKDDAHVKVKAIWTNGEESWIRLDALRIQDPYPLITYAVKKKITTQPNWEWTKDYLRDNERMASMVRAFKATVHGDKFMFGVEIPKNVRHAVELDKANGNNLWKESIEKELEMINDFQTFRRLKKGEVLAPDYKRIPYFIVFANKFDG
jgi:hypothetical protein